MSALSAAAILPRAARQEVSWLNQSEDVVAHLFFVAAEIGHVLVDTMGSTTSAVLSFPQQSNSTIDILFEQGQLAPAAGTPVQVRYYKSGSIFTFLTATHQVIAADRWRLDLPNAIARRIGRGAERFVVSDDPAFIMQIELQDATMVHLQLFDIARGGFSVLFHPQQLLLQSGDQLVGTLQLPGRVQVPLLTKVCYTRELPSTTLQQVAGCEFLGISPWGKAMLVQAMARLHT